VYRFRLAALAGAVVLLVTACAGPPPRSADQYMCEGPAYWPSTATQIENGFVAVLSAIAWSDRPPQRERPARRTIGQ